MRGNGNGGDGDNGHDEAGRPTFEEAIAAFGEPVDRFDHFALFCAKQIHALAGMMMLIGKRLDALEAELAALKAERDPSSRAHRWN
jgi:hypothetical protein